MSPNQVTRDISGKFDQVQTIEVTHSDSTKNIWKTFLNTKMSINMELDLHQINGYNNPRFNETFETAIDKSNTNTDRTKKTITIKCSFKKSFPIPPKTKYRIIAYSSVIENLEFPYTANLTISGQGPTFYNNGELIPDGIQSLIQKDNQAFNLVKIGESHRSVSFTESGQFKISMSLKIYIKLTNVDTNEELVLSVSDKEITFGEKFIDKPVNISYVIKLNLMLYVITLCLIYQII